MPVVVFELDHAAGISRHQGIVGNVAGQNAPVADRDPVPNGDTAVDHRAGPDIHIIADNRQPGFPVWVTPADGHIVGHPEIAADDCGTNDDGPHMLQRESRADIGLVDMDMMEKDHEIVEKGVSQQEGGGYYPAFLRQSPCKPPEAIDGHAVEPEFPDPQLYSSPKPGWVRAVVLQIIGIQVQAEISPGLFLFSYVWVQIILTASVAQRNLT